MTGFEPDVIHVLYDYKRDEDVVRVFTIDNMIDHTIMVREWPWLIAALAAAVKLARKESKDIGLPVLTHLNVRLARV